MKPTYTHEEARIPVTVVYNCPVCRNLRFLDGFIIFMLGIVFGMGLMFYYLIR